MTRMPAVADQFYPGDPVALRRTLDELIPSVREKTGALAVISPHAGYVYSGAVAGATFARVNIPRTAVILGPNHHGRGEPLALGVTDWSMPLGPVPVERQLAVSILRRSEVIVDDDIAHRYEHSLEVQVPFLQYFREDLSIVPICASHVSYAVCEQAARDLALGIRDFGEPVLLVASTDMTHYEPRESASRKDSVALQRILALDPAGLYETVLANRISMCGVIPTTIVLLTAIELGASRVELVRYTDSGEVSGDTSQVVGYAGLVIR
ncbi:MEMO1 family protein [Desulfolithobacter dissulfuricans]|uniref:MEMO1 family protein GF1_07230 n=1 Tax=Desulfolithobacter dissulfuricans TaxID=2795293 RepID=A0A915U4U7_9BACT|nr:AmmeMemoRadiSam system protein B [Desulfolithobacter dissulfuricans]BCO08347.1 MEMO1 family protein [Desulfolithobacter dissulfuricans]